MRDRSSDTSPGAPHATQATLADRWNLRTSAGRLPESVEYSTWETLASQWLVQNPTIDRAHRAQRIVRPPSPTQRTRRCGVRRQSWHATLSVSISAAPVAQGLRSAAMRTIRLVGLGPIIIGSSRAQVGNDTGMRPHTGVTLPIMVGVMARRGQERPQSCGSGSSHHDAVAI
jgi:hypothetical protein